MIKINLSELGLSKEDFRKKIKEYEESVQNYKTKKDKGMDQEYPHSDIPIIEEIVDKKKEYYLNESQ